LEEEEEIKEDDFVPFSGGKGRNDIKLEGGDPDGSRLEDRNKTLSVNL